MNTIRSLQKGTSALLTLPLFLLLVVQVSPAFAIDILGFGKKVAGTYLSTEGEETILLQINQDGNLTAIFSSQFSGGALNDPFSNSLGAWKRSGKRELTAQVLDITFVGESGELVGVGSSQYFLKFDKGFQRAKFRCQGAIFPQGVNPFDSGAEPISGSKFTCGDEDLIFHRLPQVQP